MSERSEGVNKAQMFGPDLRMLMTDPVCLAAQLEAEFTPCSSLLFIRPSFTFSLHRHTWVQYLCVRSQEPGEGEGNGLIMFFSIAESLRFAYARGAHVSLGVFSGAQVTEALKSSWYASLHIAALRKKRKCFKVINDKEFILGGEK